MSLESYAKKVKIMKNKLIKKWCDISVLHHFCLGNKNQYCNYS